MNLIPDHLIKPAQHSSQTKEVPTFKTTGDNQRGWDQVVREGQVWTDFLEGYFFYYAGPLQILRTMLKSH